MEPTTHIANQDKLTSLKSQLRDRASRLSWAVEFIEICKDQNRGPEAVADAEKDLATKKAEIAALEAKVAELEALRTPESELPYSKILQFFQGVNRENARNGLELLKVSVEEGCYLPGFSRRITSTLNPAKISKKANKVAFESEFAPVKAQMDHLARIIRQDPNSKFRAGTCQCCFNRQKVSKADGTRIALHGYQRPGIGFVLGRCRGEDVVPYEVSCEQTKVFRAELVEYRASLGETLADIVADKNDFYTVSVRNGTKVPCAKSWSGEKDGTILHKVVRGDKEIENPYLPNERWSTIPSFEELRRRAQRETESAINAVTADIDFLTEKIDTWTQVWPA